MSLLGETSIVFPIFPNENEGLGEDDKWDEWSLNYTHI